MKTILLVEDNEDLRELVSMALRTDGYSVYEAENGRDALQQLETMGSRPCLLLLDLMMPVMTGAELLQVLSERGELDSLPVVVLSAGGQPSQAAGAQKFIRKPADLRLVLSVVHELCGSP